MWFIFVSMAYQMNSSVGLYIFGLCFLFYLCVFQFIVAKHHQTFVTDHHTNPRRQDVHAWKKRGSVCGYLPGGGKKTDWARKYFLPLFYLIHIKRMLGHFINGGLDGILSVAKASCSDRCTTAGSKTNSFKLAKGIISWDKRFHFQLP